MREQAVDVAIVGAGVVGLACAAVLARRGDRVLVLEQNARIAEETSSRNSGVIHAGLYYPSGSLKAELCVRGRELLYARARRDGVPHRKIGKLIVACETGELEALEALRVRALQNGAGAVRSLDAAELLALEPRVRALAGLCSPETGIVDAHGLASSYLAEAKRHDAELALHTTVTAIEPREAAGFALHTRSASGEAFTLEAHALVNAAGFGAPALTGARGERAVLHPCKGDYWKLAPRLRGVVSHLVYPMPVRAGLGVHLTLGLDGSLRAGPDTEYIDTLRYDLDETKRPLFAAAIRRYLPELRDDDLSPDYAGIRPKLHGPESSFHDFVIRESAPRFIDLLGIESPGLTASEAIAERVATLLPT